MSVMIRRTRILLCGLAVAISLQGARLSAQPWDLFVDADSDSACDLINAGNAELVVLTSTGQFVLVSGIDLILVDTLVDADNLVYYEGWPAGMITFAEDADGYRTLWWLSLFGFVMDVNPFTGEPTETLLFPSDFTGVPCDACEFWDDPYDCDPTLMDEDLDGVADLFDLCPGTPLDEVADSDGCSCNQYDDDLDGVGNCDDLCPGTSVFETADVFGCSCSQYDSDLDGVDDCDDLCPTTPLGELVDIDGCPLDDLPPITINFCGSAGVASLSLMFCGLFGLGLFRRRRI
jgi:hypothetical protein